MCLSTINIPCDEQYTLQVEVIKTAIKNTTVKKAARKKRFGYGDENMEPPTVTRTSSRRRVISKTHSDSALETPATSSRSRAQVLETPANNRFPMHPLQTPMVTPKFDTTQLTRTVSRVAKAGEVLPSYHFHQYSNALGNCNLHTFISDK